MSVDPHFLILPWIALSLGTIVLAFIEDLAVHADLDYARLKDESTSALIFLVRGLADNARRRTGTALVFMGIGLSSLFLPPLVSGLSLVIGLYIVNLWLAISVYRDRLTRLRILRRLDKMAEDTTEKERF